MRSAAAIFVLALPVAACPPDLDQFRIEGESIGGEGEGEGETTGGPCPVPHLLVAEEHLRGGHGRVMRFALRDELPLQRCGDLTAKGDMMPQPFAVAWVDEHAVAVATTDGVQMIDPADDSRSWTTNHTNLWPNDAFRVETPDGRRLAVAYSAYGISNDVRNVHIYEDRGAIARDFVLNGGDLPLGLGVYSITQSPVHHDFFLAMKPIDYSAAEVDPWTNVSYTADPFVQRREETALESVFALEADLQNRVAWVGSDGEGSHVYYVLDSTGGPRLGLSLPLDCEGRACTFIHAVPDPSLNTRLIALCEEGGDYATRRIVRFRSTADECEVLYEAGAEADADDRRMSRMSVAWEVGP